MGGVTRKFLTLAEVVEQLNISPGKGYELVRSGELRAMQIGGRGQWRIDPADLDEFVARMYAKADEQRRSMQTES
jgi:excisionase family DNA binding protein